MVRHLVSGTRALMGGFGQRLRRRPLNWYCRRSCDNRVIRYVARDNRTRRDDAAGSNGHALENHGVSPDEGITLDADRPAGYLSLIVPSARLPIERMMIGVINHGTRTDVDVIFNDDFAGAIDRSARNGDVIANYQRRAGTRCQ